MFYISLGSLYVNKNSFKNKIINNATTNGIMFAKADINSASWASGNPKVVNDIRFVFYVLIFFHK